MFAANGEPHEPGQVLLALGVPVGAGQTAPGGPTSVAVHDAGDVDRSRRGPAEAQRGWMTQHSAR